MNTTFILFLVAAGAVVAGFAVGFGWGFGIGRGKYAEIVGEQAEKLANLLAEITALEFEIRALVAAPPDTDDARRLLHKLSESDRDSSLSEAD